MKMLLKSKLLLLCDCTTLAIKLTLTYKCIMPLQSVKLYFAICFRFEYCYSIIASNLPGLQPTFNIRIFVRYNFHLCECDYNNAPTVQRCFHRLQNTSISIHKQQTQY